MGAGQVVPFPEGHHNQASTIGYPTQRNGQVGAHQPTNGVVESLRSAYAAHLDKVSPGTQSNIAYRLRVAAGVLWPGMPPAECPWWEVDAGSLMMLQARLRQRYQWDSANNIVSSVRSLLRVCWMLGQVSSDQLERALAVEMLRGHNLPAGHFVDDDGWAKLFAHVAEDKTDRGVRDLAILCVMRGTGCRRSELCGIDVSDVDLNRLVITLRKTKGNKQRESGLPAWAREPLMDWMRLRGPAPGALFFPFKRSRMSYGSRLSVEGLQVVFRRRVTDAGMPELTTHDMRRGHITSALDSGVDVALVARNVGHSTPAVTLRYDKRPVQSLVDAAQRVPSPFGSDAK